MIWQGKPIDEYLKDKGIKPSILRIKIFEYLAEKKNHPNVDMIYSELKEQIPTLSKTSVYNTLHLFFEKSIVQSLTLEDNEVRYDADTTPHGHFLCINCRKIYDFNIDEGGIICNNVDFALEIYEKHLYLKGKCKYC